MDIHQLKVFVSVFKHRSFSKASHELHLSQPTISDHIKSLEEELDCKLFDRLGRTILATADAEVLHNYAVEIIEKVAQAKDSLKKIQNEPAGNLTIGASTIPGTYLLPEILKSFQKTYPRITPEILISDSKEIFEKVLSHELLMGIIGAKFPTQKIAYTPLIEDNLILVSSPDLIKKNSLKIEELRSYPLILREEGSGTRRETERFLTSAGLSPESLNIAGVFGSTEAVKEAVKAGLGISILSRFSVKDELSRGTIREIKIHGLNMKRFLYIIVHKKRTLPHHYKLFCDYILKMEKK